MAKSIPGTRRQDYYLDMLKSSVIEALTWARDAWLSASDSQKERAMVYIDTLLDQLNRGMTWNDAYKKDMLLEDFDEPFTKEEQV